MAEHHDVVLHARSPQRAAASAAYSESKLFVTALALAVARHWSDVLSNAVDPGWLPTKMGGPGAPDDLTQGHLTQTSPYQHDYAKINIPFLSITGYYDDANASAVEYLREHHKYNERANHSW